MLKSKYSFLFVIIIASVYALIVRLIFGAKFLGDFLEIMSVSFLVFVPLSIGVLTLVLSPKSMSGSYIFRFFAPCVPVIVFLVLTTLLNMEGLICWIMALPVFLGVAILTCVITGAIMDSMKNRSVKLSVFIIILLPLLLSPIEKQISIQPASFRVNTSIEINSTPEKIWDNVVRVREISEREDKGKLSKFMGFPRPIKAELDSLAIGGKRKAIFSGGLVFDEKVFYYESMKKMSFTITPVTENIPAATLDEHVTVGGKYFTVLDGTYELEKIGENKYKLILYSHFQMNTTFNFYSGLWSKWIMADIQNNILHIIKNRCEGN